VSSSEDEGDLDAGAGSDLVGRKFQLAKAFDERVKGARAVAELGTPTTEDGEEADVLWRQCDGPSTGDVFYEFSGVEEARAWVKEHNQS
jgi:hypothetical protein